MSDHNPAACDECGRREMVTYRCTVCPAVFEVDGEYRYFAQGRGHWHEAYDKPAFNRFITEHIASHGGAGSAGIIPATNTR